MLTRIAGGRVVDPTAGRDSVSDVWIEDGRIVAPSDRAPDRTIDAAGCIVMAGGVEVHSHIAGGNVVLARLLLPELGVSEPDAPNPHGSGRDVGLLAMPAEAAARVVRQQAAIVDQAPDEALATLPSLVPTAEERGRLLAVLKRLATHLELEPEQRSLMPRFEQLLGSAPGPEPAPEYEHASQPIRRRAS